MACTYCGSEAHSVQYCPGTWGGSARRMRGERPRCSYCGESTHNRDACPKAWPGHNPQVRRD